MKDDPQLKMKWLEDQALYEATVPPFDEEEADALAGIRD